MLMFFILAGYTLIGFYVGVDVRRALVRCRVEVRPCFGRRMVYLRERKTGRLIGCSRNPFTLILQVTS